MIVLCILALVWLGVRAATTWRMCARVVDGHVGSVTDHDTAGWRLRDRQAAAPQVSDKTETPQDAPHASPGAATDDVTDVWAPTRAALLLLGRELAKALGVSAARWAASVRPVEPVATPVAEEAPGKPSFFAVPRPAGGPAYLGGREDSAYLRGWDDAVDWVSDSHDAATPTWGGVAYMTGWDDAVRAIAKARVS